MNSVTPNRVNAVFDVFFLLKLLSQMSPHGGCFLCVQISLEALPLFATYATYPHKATHPATC